MPFVSDRWGVFPNSIELSVFLQLSVMSATAPRILKNFSPSHVKSLFCTDKIESIELQDRVPRQRIGDCLSRFTLLVVDFVISRYQVTDFSARSTASPVRFLQGALVILVLLQMSQFLSFGKWVSIRCFLDVDTTFAGRSESESCELCAGAGTFVSSKLSSFGFSFAHFCFTRFWAALPILIHTSGHTWSGMEVVWILASLSPDHMYPLGRVFFQWSKLCVYPFQESDKLLFKSTFQQSSTRFFYMTFRSVRVDLVMSKYF